MSSKLPDFRVIEPDRVEKRPFPIPEPPRIRFTEAAYQGMHCHARENHLIEVGGLLLGKIYQDERGPYLEITAVIAGQDTLSQSAEVTFTHATWEKFYQEKDEKYPGLLMVGWYHTHPGHGIFLSSPDIFIHENFFSQPYQIAFVIDPINQDEGLFLWQNSRVERCKQFWVGQEQKGLAEGGKQNTKNILRSTEVSEFMTQQSSQNLRPVLIATMFILLSAISALSLLYLLRMDGSFRSLSHSFTSLEQNLLNAAQPTNQIIQTRDYGEAIKLIISEDERLTDLDIQIRQNGNHIWCLGEVYTWFQKEELGKAIGSIAGIESVDLQGIIVTHHYISRPGDTLSSIANKVYGDRTQWAVIYEANRSQLNDPDILEPSTPLVLPKQF